MVAINKTHLDNREIDHPYLYVFQRAMKILRAAEARANGEPLVLTDDERCAAAFLAGVEIESSSYVGGRLTLAFVPFHASYDGHTWNVYSQDAYPPK